MHSIDKKKLFSSLFSMSLAESIKRLETITQNCVTLPRLTSEQASLINMVFVKSNNDGTCLYKSTLHTDDLVDTVDFCSRMFDWDMVKAEFKKRGINVLGPDKHVIMSRALAVYRTCE